MLLGSSPVSSLELVLPPDLSTFTFACSPKFPTHSLPQLCNALSDLSASMGLLSLLPSTPTTHYFSPVAPQAPAYIQLPRQTPLFFFHSTLVSFPRLTGSAGAYFTCGIIVWLSAPQHWRFLLPVGPSRSRFSPALSAPGVHSKGMNNIALTNELNGEEKSPKGKEDKNQH